MRQVSLYMNKLNHRVFDHSCVKIRDINNIYLSFLSQFQNGQNPIPKNKKKK